MPNTRADDDQSGGSEDKLQLASTKCVVNYGFYIGATPDNVDD